MTINVANTFLTNTYDYWRTRTNELATAMSTYAVTTNSNTAIGNASISGTFSANVISVGNSVTINATSFSGTSNNSLYIGGLIASNVVSNAQLQANLSNYANTSAPYFSTSISVGNSVSNITIIAPNTSQISSGNYFLNANGSYAIVSSNSIFVGNNSIQAVNLTTSSLANVNIDTFPSTSFRSAEYLISIKDNNNSANYQLSKLLVVHDNTTVSVSEYGTVLTNALIGSFDASITANTLSLQFIPASSNTVINANRIAITV
jgi:hypothetical protein